MSQLIRNFTIDGVPTDMTAVFLSDPTGAFGVIRNDTGAVIVADGTAMTHTAVGTYEFSWVDPADDLTYTYWLEVTYAGETYHVEGTLTGPTSGVSTDAMAALALAVSYCNRTFDVALHEEIYDSRGDTQLFLRNYPVLRINKIEFRSGSNWVDATVYERTAGELAPEGVDFKARTAEARCNYFAAPYQMTRGFQNVRVTYVAGYGTVTEAGVMTTVLPADLAKALEDLALNLGTPDSGMSSEKLGDYSYSKGSTAIPARIQATLNRYRDVFVKDT